jgi:hypothetical protein
LFVGGCYLGYRFHCDDIFLSLKPYLGWFWDVFNISMYKPKNPGLMLLGVLHLLAFGMLRMTESLASGICFLAAHSYSMLLFHTNRIVILNLYFSLLRCSEYTDPHDQALFAQIKNVCVTSLLSITIDLFRGTVEWVFLLVIDVLWMAFVRLKSLNCKNLMSNKTHRSHS